MMRYTKAAEKRISAALQFKKYLDKKKKQSVLHAVNRTKFVSAFVDERLGWLPKWIMKIGPLARLILPYDVHEINSRIYIVRRKDMMPVRVYDRKAGVINLE